jgi:hypothetical protein
MKLGYNYWFVRTPWDSGPFPETTVAGAAQPGRYKPYRPLCLMVNQFAICLLPTIYGRTLCGAKLTARP